MTNTSNNSLVSKEVKDSAYNKGYDIGRHIGLNVKIEVPPEYQKVPELNKAFLRGFDNAIEDRLS